MSSNHQTFTLTFGEVCENHIHNEQIGHIAERGFSYIELDAIRQHFIEKGCNTEMIYLNDLLFDEDPNKMCANDANVLVIRDGLSALLSDETTKQAFFDEQNALDKDKKALIYGRVVNKHARHNLCFADFGHPPAYENGMGTVVAFNDVPILAKVRQEIFNITGKLLFAEGNYYYDTTKCGIGYHGDAERRLVVGIRVGEAMPLHYRWYRNGKVISRTEKIVLGDGDMYVMCDKAVGFDWRKRSIYTLRHAAGCEKYIDEENDIITFPQKDT